MISPEGINYNVYDVQDLHNVFKEMKHYIIHPNLDWERVKLL